MDGKQKLLRAVTYGDITALRKMHDSCGIDWNKCVYDKTGDSALHIASRAGFPDTIKYLHEEGGMSLEQTNYDGKRPLHDASQFSQLKCVEYLVEKGVEIDPVKRADWTPLMLACTKQDAGIVKLLTDHGASPILRNKDGWNSFHLACREGNISIVGHLLSIEPRLLCQSRSKNGRTPLHTAALHGHLDVVKLLVATGTYLEELKDTCGTTPLMDAIRAGHISIARHLVENNICTIESRDGLGRASIHLAAQAGCKESVEFLLDQCKTDVNLPSNDNSRPLHLAAREGHTEIVYCLIRRGANESLTDSYGRTALMVAENYKQLSCVEALNNSKSTIKLLL